MTQAIQCVGLSLGLVNANSGSPQVYPPDEVMLQLLAPMIERRQGVMAEHSSVICALFREVDQAVDCACAIFECLGAADAEEQETLAPRMAIEAGEIELAGRELGGRLKVGLQTLLLRTPNYSLVIGRNASAALDVRWACRTRPLVRGALMNLEPGEGEVLAGAIEMPWRVDASPHQEATVVGEVPEVDTLPSEQLQLVVAGVSRELTAADCPYTIGRDTRCDLVLSSGESSRLHATITYEHGRFYYVDSSRNGSYLLTAAGEELYVHNERHWLVGKGAISPGTQVMNQTGELIRYVCDSLRTSPVPAVGAAMMASAPDPGTTIRR